MGTSFGRHDFRDCLGGQELVMIGQWHSRQPLTNHKWPLFTQTIPGIIAPKACIHSPSSFWSGESIQPAIVLFSCCPCLNEGKHAKINRLLFFRTIRLQLRHRHHHLLLGLLEVHHHSTLSYNCFLNLVGVSSPSRHRDLHPNVQTNVESTVRQLEKGEGWRRRWGTSRMTIPEGKWEGGQIVSNDWCISWTRKNDIQTKKDLYMNVCSFHIVQKRIIPLIKPWWNVFSRCLTSVVMRPDVIAHLQRQREEKARLTSLEKMSFFVKENLLSLQCSRLSLYAHLYKTDTQSWSLLFFSPFIWLSIRRTPL